MIFNFHRTNYVDKNGIFNQLRHIESEIKEAIQAAQSTDDDHLDDEIMDIGHSWETLVRMRQEYDKRDMSAAKSRVSEKNHSRGYYDAD